MAKYIFVNRSAQAFDISKLPKEQVAKLMQAWGEWVGSMGSTVLDEGNPFNPGAKNVTKDGVTDGDVHAAGYMIIEAKDFDEALNVAKSSPIVARGGTVEVYEAFGV